MSIVLRGLSASLLLSCAGCDGLYTPVTDGKGNVVVVNRFTGSVQKADDRTTASIIASASGEAHRPTLAPIDLTSLPLRIDGSAKYLGGKMIVKVSLRPHTVSLDERGWTRWRAYMERARAKHPLRPAIVIEFTDSEGFQIATHPVELADTTSIVNDSGEDILYTEQFALPMSEEEYREVGAWEISWSGWPEWTAAAAPAKGT